MALVRMKPPVGVSVGLGADEKLYYIDGQGFANVDSGSVTKLTAEGWVSAVPVAPETPGNTFPVSASKTLTGVIEILMPDGSTRGVPSVENMQSSTPISLTGTTSQKTLIVARIPAEKLFPGCRITADFEFSRDRNGLGSITYGIYLNDYFAKAVGQGEQIIATPSMATSSQDVRREVATVILGADLRHQKFLQNAATSGGMGNLNKYLDCNYNGNKGLAIIVAATLANATDVFTIESYKIEVTK
jgi:hypothetical protein